MKQKQQSAGQGQWSDLPAKKPVGRPAKEHGRINMKLAKDVYETIKAQSSCTEFVERLVREWVSKN